MTNRTGNDPQTAAFNPAAIRRHLAVLCESVAATQDQVATTYDHLAQTRPRDAARLRARATVSRQYAKLERRRAARYRSAP